MCLGSSSSCFRRYNAADFNIFGYDPDGRIAHLVALFYGPNWIPITFRHLCRHRPLGNTPRYGPPGPGQLGWDWPDFMPFQPPVYFMSPSAPYLPAPGRFDIQKFGLLAGLKWKESDHADGGAFSPLHLKIWLIYIQSFLSPLHIPRRR